MRDRHTYAALVKALIFPHNLVRRCSASEPHSNSCNWEHFHPIKTVAGSFPFLLAILVPTWVSPSGLAVMQPSIMFGLVFAVLGLVFAVLFVSIFAQDPVQVWPQCLTDT